VGQTRTFFNKTLIKQYITITFRQDT